MKITRDVRFAWTQADGTVAVTQLADFALTQSENDDECIAFAVAEMKRKGVMPAAAAAVRVAKADIPADPIQKRNPAWLESVKRRP